MSAASAPEVDDRPTVVSVEHVSMVFNIANQQLNNLKEYAIALMRRELMFKEFVALDDVSLEVKKGDVFGILGTNGSGKSTLLKIIAGVLEPTRGSVTISGSIAPLIELGAGFDFELTARENIYLNGALLGYPRKFIDEHFDDIVDFAEIGDFLDMPIKNYSSGMVARIAFAIATVIVPDILIVDEVLSVGDFMFQQKCEQKIQSLINDHGVTVLIVSHNNDQIERLCNKAIWIEKGHTRIMGTAEEVCGIYRALGGHTGSAESEARVLELIEADAEGGEDALVSVAGETRYGTNARLARAAAADGCETVVVAPGEDAPLHLLACAMAGALGGAALITKPDELPDATASVLAAARAKHLVVLAREGQLAEGITSSIEQAAGMSAVVLEAPTLPALSARANDHVREQGCSFGPVAFVASDNCAMVSATASPYLARHACQLLFATEAEPLRAQEAESLAAAGAQEVVVLGQPSFAEGALDAFARANVPVTRLSAPTAEEAHAQAFDWLTAKHRATGEPISAVVVAKLGDATDAYSAAALAARDHAVTLLINHNDLDSMARALAFIEGEGGTIERITVVGGESDFNATDKRLFAKALARAAAR